MGKIKYRVGAAPGLIPKKRERRLRAIKQNRQEHRSKKKQTEHQPSVDSSVSHRTKRPEKKPKKKRRARGRKKRLRLLPGEMKKKK